MISTATAAENASAALPVATSQPTSVASESTSTTGTKTPETRSTSRWIGAFPDCASATSVAIWASAVSSPTLRRANDQTPVRVDRGAGDGVARADVVGHGLAGEHRVVDRRCALDDDTVRRDLLARPHDEQVARHHLGDRDRELDAVAQDVCLLGAELEETADRGARSPPCARLEVAPEQDERRDHGRDLEVHVCAVDEKDRRDRPAPCGERADRDECVHRRGAVPRVHERRAVEVEACPEDDGRRQCEREPLPAAELHGRGHREHDERRRRGRLRRRACAGSRRRGRRPFGPRPRAPRGTRPPRPRRGRSATATTCGSKRTAACSVA